MNIIEDLITVNFEKSRYGAIIDTIVFHSMGGFYKGTISWFKNPDAKVSAHYLISKEGEIRIMVKEEHRAWHAGTWNNRSIGIELEDEKKGSNWKYTEKQKEALRWLVRDIESRYGKLNYVLHKDISSNRSDPVGDFSLSWITNLDNNDMADYYKGLDLNNKESIKVAVDEWANVRDGKYVKKEEYDKKEEQYNNLKSELTTCNINKKSAEDRAQNLEEKAKQSDVFKKDLDEANKIISKLKEDLLGECKNSEALTKELKAKSTQLDGAQEEVRKLDEMLTITNNRISQEYVKLAKNSVLRALQRFIYDFDNYKKEVSQS